MKNSVTVSVVFDFKGKRYAPDLELDLDSYMQQSGCLPDLYPLLASVCNLGLYSYEYEMLQSEELICSHAKGLVIDHIVDGVLDLKGFEAAWLGVEALKKLTLIAKNLLDIDDLTTQPKLKEALIAAYKLGQSEPVKEDVSFSHSF